MPCHNDDNFKPPCNKQRKREGREPRTMATGTRQFRILIVAAESNEAEAILRRLNAASLPVQGSFTQNPGKLPALLRARQCDLLLVSVSERVKASELASICREAEISTPILILDLNGHDAASLVELMETGARGLIRDLDDGRLLAAIKERIKLGGEAGLALFPQPPEEGATATSGGCIDSESGLPDRNALLGIVSDYLSNAGPAEQVVTLVYAGLEDFAMICKRDGMAQGLRYAAETASTIRSAMPEGTVTARVADDACAILFRDVAEQDPPALAERMNHLLAATDAETLGLRLGIAFGNPGTLSASRLLDLAYADSLGSDSSAPQTPSQTPSQTYSSTHTGGESSSGFDSLVRALHLDDFELSAPPPSNEAPPGNDFESEPLAETSEELASAFASSSPPDSAPARANDGDYGEVGGANFVDDSITDRIEDALETDGFSIIYKPIVSLMGDSQEHYSVLLRLRKEHERTLTASELLGPAARAGNLPKVDRWVIQRALNEQAKRRKLGQKVGCFLSLSEEIVRDDRLLIWICDALRQFEVRGSWVTFQLQEREALSLGDKWTTLAEGLKKIKCRVCINQFGMQENPELAMTTMGADFVKFAPEFAIGLANDPRMQQRLLRLIKMAKDKNVRTIVTGVEDARSLALLWGAGIHYVQGNFLQSGTPNLDDSS